MNTFILFFTLLILILFQTLFNDKSWSLMDLHWNSRNFSCITIKIGEKDLYFCEVTHLRGKGRGGVLYSDARQVAALFLLPVCLNHANKAHCTQLEKPQKTPALLCTYSLVQTEFCLNFCLEKLGINSKLKSHFAMKKRKNHPQWGIKQFRQTRAVPRPLHKRWTEHDI